MKATAISRGSCPFFVSRTGQVHREKTSLLCVGLAGFTVFFSKKKAGSGYIRNARSNLWVDGSSSRGRRFYIKSKESGMIFLPENEPTPPIFPPDHRETRVFYWLIILRVEIQHIICTGFLRGRAGGGKNGSVECRMRWWAIREYSLSENPAPGWFGMGLSVVNINHYSSHTLSLDCLGQNEHSW